MSIDIECKRSMHHGAILGGNTMRQLGNTVLLLFLSCLAGVAQVNMLTANGGNDRTNANLLETRLSPSSVSSSSFGRIASIAVDGQVYAQTHPFHPRCCSGNTAMWAAKSASSAHRRSTSTAE